MAEDFGPGVSRTLTALAEQFTTVVWQADKPPLDSELNLMSQVEWENLSQAIRSQVHSGFFLDPTRCEADYYTNPMYSNQFILGQPGSVSGNYEDAPPLYAAVNGWVIPIAGSNMPMPMGIGAPMANRVLLYPPPASDSRTDFVFLEVWRCMIAPNPSTSNKPNAAELWKYGNVQYGGSNLLDEIEDPAVGYETTQRVQLQYRIRVVGSGDGLGTSVDLKTFPDGLTDPNVLGQGTATSPVAGMTFTNMRDELGDPSLWRAGDGDPANDLGTVDGYVYAVPICAVFRRNTTPFTAISTGTPNQNGGETRTPSSTSPTDARYLWQATLMTNLAEGTTGWVQINDYAQSGLDDPNLFPVGTLRRYLVVGTGIDAEIIAINQNTDPVGHGNYIFIDLIGRGRAGTQARYHHQNTGVSLYCTRPDGLYADQIAATDILDMRRSINFGDWDYNRLLQKGVAALIQNNLRTTFKTSGTGGDSTGPVTTEVSLFTTAILPPTYTGPVDATNAIRTVWSDSAALQSDVTVILNDQAALDADHITSTTFDTLSVSDAWSPGADFQPHGFLNHGTGTQGWCNGSVIFVDIGGADGISGARYGLRGGQKSVRFMSPREMWRSASSGTYSHHPWALRFIGGVDGNRYDASPTTNPNNDDNAYRAGYITTPTATSWWDPSIGYVRPGPMYPMAESNFEKPFIVLGGVVRSDLRFTGIVADAATLVNIGTGPGYTQFEVNFPSINWDTYSLYLGRDQKSLGDYLTNGGVDYTGLSSRLYLVIYGDATYPDNNGAFQVVGAGTVAANYTQNVSTDAVNGIHRLVVRPLSADFKAFQDSPNTVTIEFRSQDTYAEDDNGSATPPAGIAVVLTDLRGLVGTTVTTPWGAVDSNYILKNDGTDRLYPITSKAVLTTDLLWSPNRGASQRVPDQIFRFGVQSPPSSFIRSPVSVTDSFFVPDTGYPTGDIVYPTTQVQLWNRLPSVGKYAPYAVNANTNVYGGNIVGNSEQDREAELFVDPGSKTAVFRPFQKKTIILKGMEIIDPYYGTTLYGVDTYPGGGVPKDGNGLFEVSHTEAYIVPPEFMPRFGRQDIPYHLYTGSSDPIYPGINHLFLDQPGNTAEVFDIIGGADNGGGAGVLSILFDTSAFLLYGTAGTVGGAPHTAYGARKCQYPSPSSDLGDVVRGVELPPYLGIARLYGVYERSDFLAHCDATNVGAFLNNDRATSITGTGGTPPTNLLRTDAWRQTLFIKQYGAIDITQQNDSHTYIVPESAIDITKIPTWSYGDLFDNYDYVVEAVVFGFGEGFINKNSYVFARLHNGVGTVTLTTSDKELGMVDVVLPSAPPTICSPYEVYDRTVYQGDPYMTRDGATIQTADYTTRYGQIPVTDAYSALGVVYPQFVSLASNVECPNARALEVLATMDFYTTLGTGKMGGSLYSDTVTDCGYTTPPATNAIPRWPPSSSYYPWVILPHAFTEGQNDNTSFAKATIQILDYSQALARFLNVLFNIMPSDMGGFSTILTAGTHFTGASNEIMAVNLAAAINSSTSLIPYLYAQANGTTVYVTMKIPGAFGNQSSIYLSSTGGTLLSIATVQNPSSIQPRASVEFGGGADIPMNAGGGNSIVAMTGMTERLPLGLLVQDSDFMAENLLGDGATSLRSYPGSLRGIYVTVPLTSNGFEYTRFLGEPGTILELCDGAILQYVAYNSMTAPTGTKKYRIFRGGGASFVLSGTAPGGPITWVSDSFSKSVQPVLKGAALACKAILVRNYHEDAFGVATNRTEGDEIQMLVLTQAVYGTTTTTSDGVTLSGIISPSGYGYNYAAADRYLMPGRPMDRGRTRTTPSLAIIPAPYYGS